MDVYLLFRCIPPLSLPHFAFVAHQCIVAKEDVGLVLVQYKAQAAGAWGLREGVLEVSERPFAEPTKRNRLL